MILYADMTREIAESPSGPKVGAFFDLDRTLLAGFSSIAFFKDRLFSGRMGPKDVWEGIAGAAGFQLGRIGFSGFVAASAGMLAGLSESAFEEIGERVFEEQLIDAIYPEARALIRAHRARGHTLAIVSSATRFQIEPLARELGIPHVVCTQLEVEDGAFTGRVVRPTCYGEGKAILGRELAGQLGIDLEQSYFYTDSDEDLPLLEIVGRPHPINPNRRLERIAAERAWPVRHFRSRSRPGLIDFVRTQLTLTSLLPSLGLGIPAGLAAGSTRQAINTAMATWGELGSAMAGLHLHVSGEEHLWSDRPAVFVFNHHSAVDLLVLCKLLRRDCVGVAPGAMRLHPIWGPLYAAVGTVFVDGLNTENSRPDFRKALYAVREGLSLIVAPQTRRTPSPRLAPFRRDAFQLAMEAKIPIVPIVIVNAADAMPTNGWAIRSSTVEVHVLPPIPTRDWDEADVDVAAEETEMLFLETLSG